MDGNLWIIVSCGLAGGLALVVAGRLRGRPRAALAEAVRSSAIAELEPGRFRVIGRVVPIATSPSAVDGADCVYAESASYQAIGTGLVPLLREVAHGASAHPFYLDDGTGRVLVDPARTLIECATATADGGLTAERRVRAGEEVALVATFTTVDAAFEPGDGPYRAGATRWAPVSDAAGPPRLSHRTLASMIAPPPDDLAALMSGIGGMMFLMSSLLGLVTAFLR